VRPRRVDHVGEPPRQWDSGLVTAEAGTPPGERHHHERDDQRPGGADDGVLERDREVGTATDPVCEDDVVG
jgi:hypothetical protein